LSTPGSFPVDRIIPAGVFGSLWMNPKYLAQLQPNRVLDSDPVTGVGTVALGQQNGIAYLAAQTGLARNTLGYDLRNGLLTFAELRQQVGIADTAVTVRLVGTD
jgi:hypothetical protein